MKYSEYKVIKNRIPAEKLFCAFKDDRLPFLLESRRDISGMGRYSFFSSSPFLAVSFKNGISCIERYGKRDYLQKPILSVLRELLKKYELQNLKKPIVPFLCGAVGFFSYDFGFYLEDIKRIRKKESIVPEVMFGFYDTCVCLDKYKNELIIFSSGFPEEGHARKSEARARLNEILAKLDRISSVEDSISKADSPKLKSNFTERKYISAIKRAKEYIARGDIYQVNLSQKFSTRSCIDDWSLYRRLARRFPVSFSGFFKAGDFSIISASPEKFLEFDGRRVSTRPMKGTRPRTNDPVLNRKMRKELIESKKEKAELLMIVDLERNDLGRVCEYGSIVAGDRRQIEAYRSVFQATREVEGVLHCDKDRLDLIKACFPGGSVTGAPKIRAMEIIEELEPDRRNVYTGSLGFLSFHNTLEFNILIRSFLKIGDEISFHVGGGIVTDSIPDAEYEETIVKAKVLLEALYP